MAAEFVDFCYCSSLGNHLERDGSLARSKIKPKILVYSTDSDQHNRYFADNLFIDSKREEQLSKIVVESINESFSARQFTDTIFNLYFSQSYFLLRKK